MLKRDFANKHDNFAYMDRNSIQFNSIEWLTMASPRYSEFSLWRNGHAPLPWYGSYIHNGWPVRSSSSSERSFKSSLCTSVFLTILVTSSQLDCNCAFLSSSWRKSRPTYTLDEDKDTISPTNSILKHTKYVTHPRYWMSRYYVLTNNKGVK